ncbi:hypothetical protein A3SI_09558 [Nitritalea halalkaliphila LW7]|uniref:Uncharacterized protein n=1 Tax=Nitritalea halalkaliphila LW7 TaxID=1189621 RepID=I5C4D3_9BACT|nr:hypothetical protein [Nitritalea halalkaliphila]EIM76685.1 hypothetical protein A3SI_09558 [Nitritalea halalkaliphila LW7]
MKTFLKIVLFLAALLLLYNLYLALHQAGPQDLVTQFEEMDRYRNENNTGPVLRIYTVKIDREDYMDMQRYGDFMPHTKYGKTIVFFFDEQMPVQVKARPDYPHIDRQLQPFCIAKYEKDGMGQVRFQLNPFEKIDLNAQK